MLSVIYTLAPASEVGVADGSQAGLMHCSCLAYVMTHILFPMASDYKLQLKKKKRHPDIIVLASHQNLSHIHCLCSCDRVVIIFS